MSIFRIFQQGIVVGLSITCSAIVMAAPGEEGPESAMLDCVAVTDDVERLRCFDDQVSAIQPTPAVVDTADKPSADSLAVEETAVIATATQSAAAEAAETPSDAPAAVQQAETPPAGSGSSPATSDVDEFGMTAELSNQLPADERAVELTEISATVTEVSKRPYGEHIVTLDNGQVWTEKDAEYGFRVKVGDTIVIKKGKLGGYRIVARGNRSSAVIRIK